MPTPDMVKKALRQVKDPELGLNIIDIGLVYDVAVGEAGEVKITMTLTSPGCPSGAEIMEDARMVAEELEGVQSATVELSGDQMASYSAELKSRTCVPATSMR